ncbi:MAG TPA: acyl-CoA synthetase [Mycobacterium sp.]|nr:acyl-CoA synthetase [Mycobacterium sp.]
MRESGLSGGPLDGARSYRFTKKYGPFAGVIESAAHRNGDAIAITDDVGDVTYNQLSRRVNALARAWAELGLGPGDVVAALCRDHRNLISIIAAANKVGVQLVLMNTGFAKPQLADVVQREGISMLVHDREFTDLLGVVDPSVRRLLSDPWPIPDTGALTLEALIASTSDGQVPAPEKVGGLTLLTSGTSGTPKGAPRGKASPLFSAQLLDRVPRRRGETCYVAAPVFHGTGLGQAVLSLGLADRLVLRRKFDPESTLRVVEDYRCDVLILVPTMLQRILALPDEVLNKYDTSSLRILFASGSAMAPDLVTRALDRFGPVVYNQYGSTELAVMTVAMPADLVHNPATVGLPPVGCRVALFDDNGRPITTSGTVGRIFAGNMLTFGGYSDGRKKEVIDGLLSSGDVGHFDDTGRLYVDGRDDDMIISGGENVYPLEVENLINSHPDVDEAAVVGVPDQDFGQRLAAYVVTVERASLTAEAIKDYVRVNLARYKVPRDVVFLDALPRNATGKIVRSKLDQGAVR